VKRFKDEMKTMAIHHMVLECAKKSDPSLKIDSCKFIFLVL
jgi:hypothetical protein